MQGLTLKKNLIHTIFWEIGGTLDGCYPHIYTWQVKTWIKTPITWACDVEPSKYYFGEEE